jgi:hypothetical protein
MFFNQPPTAKLGYFSTPTSEQKNEKDRFELRTYCVQVKNGLCMDNMRFAIATNGHALWVPQNSTCYVDLWIIMEEHEWPFP